MKLKRWTAALGMLGTLGMSGLASAQERGRTDGPENSEWGKGGYEDPSGGRVSLTLDWGAAFPEARRQAPLFVGGTASYWLDDWFILDGSYSYVFAQEWNEILVGPRFRGAGVYPIALWGAVKAGAIVLGNGNVRFGLSPQAGVDFHIQKIWFGLGYAADFALGVEEPLPVSRVFMNVGYRF